MSEYIRRTSYQKIKNYVVKINKPQRLKSPFKWIKVKDEFNCLAFNWQNLASMCRITYSKIIKIWLQNNPQSLKSTFFA